MKNKLSTFIGIILLCAAAAFTCTGCIDKGAYAVEVVRHDWHNTEENDDDIVKTDDRTITIGNSSYDVKWSETVRPDENDKLCDRYEVIDSEDKFLPGTIMLDPETGEIISFRNVEPYPAIKNMDTLSDEELKSAAEQLLGDLADFSRYNFFEVTRPRGIIGTNTDTMLRWQVKRDILCQISVTVYISEDGLIYDFGKTDACPDGTAESYIPKDERIKLLEKGICEHLGIRSLDGSGYKYNILYETLSYCRNEVSVTYGVEILDKQDFAELILIRVYKR